MITEIKVSLKSVRIEDTAVVAQNAGNFKSEIYLIKGNKQINAKSIMGVISLEMKHNDTIYIRTEGVDEEAATARIKELL